MTFEIIDCEQGTPEWFAARMGIPTGSKFATVMASGRSGADSKTRKKYLYQLAGEIITGEPMETYSNGHMQRGKDMEAQARLAYQVVRDVKCEQIGFIRSGRKGVSPDSFVGADGMVEIKTKLPDLMIETIFRGGMPPEHKAQCQGQLWVAERDWVDVVAFWPGMPVFIHREHREDDYIRALSMEVDQFNAELDKIVARVREYAA